jgi:plastocyanin
MKISIVSLLLFLALGSASAIDVIWTFKPAGYPPLEIQEGDTVTFIWTGSHNVYKFHNKVDFENCDFTKADFVCDASPCPLIEDLHGKFHFFGCERGDGGAFSHCARSDRNMKLQIIVPDDDSDSGD